VWLTGDDDGDRPSIAQGSVSAALLSRTAPCLVLSIRKNELKPFIPLTGPVDLIKESLKKIALRSILFGGSQKPGLESAMKSDQDSTIQSVGFDEMLAHRQEMLDRYAVEKNKSKNAPVQVWHGKVAEAELRRWLRSFLPDKFGVTKGSVMHPKLGRHYELREHDVIIYDKQEAPILWKKESPGCSGEDTAKGIQAEHVHAVLEVKATLTVSHAKAAIEKLGELYALQRDAENSPGGPDALKPEFFCAAVFFDHANSKIIEHLIPPQPLVGYCGAMILGAEGDTTGCSGRVELMVTESSHENAGFPLFKDLRKLKFKKVSKNKEIKIPPQGALNLCVLSDEDILDGHSHGPDGKAPDYRWYYEKAYSVHSGTVPWPSGRNVCASLTWSESVFSRFALEIGSRLRGTFERGKLESLYGLRFHGTL
jgi:hypothetical protein